MKERAAGNVQEMVSREKKKKKVNIAPSIRDTFCLVHQMIFKSVQK